MQDTANKVTSQFPAFRLTVARQMADYRQRMAERVATEREAQSLSREALAYKSGVSDKTIKRIEERKTTPRPVTVRRLAKGLGLSPSDLRPSPEDEGHQLDRIEAKLDAVLDHLAVPADRKTPAKAAAAAAERAAERVARQSPSGRQQSRDRANKRRTASG